MALIYYSKKQSHLVHTELWEFQVWNRPASYNSWEFCCALSAESPYHSNSILCMHRKMYGVAENIFS